MIKRIAIIFVSATVSANAEYLARFGSVDVTNRLTVTNSASIGGSLGVTNGATFNSGFFVGGTSTFSGPITLTTNSPIGGPAVFNGAFTHNGIVMYVSNLYAYAGISAQSAITSSGDVGCNRLVVLGVQRIDSNGSFYGNAYNLTNFPPSLVLTNDARYLAALTNESDTLATVLGRGNSAAGLSATNFADISGTGRRVFGTGLSLANINATAAGASQSGDNEGTQTIGNYAVGSSQNGGNSGTKTIGNSANGASQNGFNSGTQSIGAGSDGAFQNGYSGLGSSATNNGTGAMQLFDLTFGQNALTTVDGDASILLGAGTASHKNAIVAGDGEVSHGNGTITAGGGFFHGSNPVLTNPAAFWQHASTVIAPTTSYSIAFSGPAAWNAASNRYDILPYSTTNYGAITGSVTITMANNAYLSEVGGTWYYSTVSGLTPARPVSYDLKYITSSSAVLSAWCSTNAGDAVPPYYAYFSNLVVYTYDRSMSPFQYTNDAAGIVARCDPLPSGNTDTRRVVNSASLTAAISAAKPAIAMEAWSYMPSGARQPSLSLVTLDKPLVQQGTVNYIQSGDYFAQSYRGVWDQATTGGVWRIGPNGKTALEITSTNIWLAISSFSVRTNVASFTIETNNVVGTPYIEYCPDLVAAQWTYATGQTITNNTTNWTATCPTVATMLFFRAVSPGGANKIVSHYQHQFNAGLRATSLQQTAGGYNDLNFPATTIYNVGLTDIEPYSVSNAILFKTTCNTNFASDNAWVTAQLPHSIATNSPYIYPHIHFAQDSATLTGAVFLIRYKRYSPGAAIPTTWTDLPTSNVFTYTAGTIHQIADTTGIPGPFALSELIDFKIWYRGSTGPVLLKFFDLHYRSDGLGSTTIYTKDF